jgi:hypothetical protein
MQSKKWTSYFAILLSTIFLLQGCVAPKTGQISIPLPKNISYPSALVIKDKYIGILSMEGQFDPLYKVDGRFQFNHQEIIDSNKQKSCSFLIKSISSLFSTCSIWDLNYSTQKLNCLIPSLRNVSSSGGIYLSPDKKYLKYYLAYLQKEIKVSKPFGLYYNGIFESSKLYSIQKQNIVNIPKIKGLKFWFYRFGLLPDSCLLVYYKSTKPKEFSQFLYFWDLKNNKMKQIILPEFPNLPISWIRIYETSIYDQMIIEVRQDNNNNEVSSMYAYNAKKDEAKLLFTETQDLIQYYREFNWFVICKNNTLFRYDIKLKKKEILHQFDSKPSFIVFENKSMFIETRKNASILDLLLGKIKIFQTTYDYYLLRLDGVWVKISDFFQDMTIDSVSPISFDTFLLSINNQSKGIHQVIKWNPSTNSREIVFEEKNCINISISEIINRELNMDEDYQAFSGKLVGHYFQFTVKMNEKDLQNYIYNRFSKEVKKVSLLNSPDIWVQTFGQLIWIRKKTSYKTTNLSLLDWENPANVSPVINFTEKTHQKKSYYMETLSPDKIYIPIVGFSEDDYSDEQLWFVNVQTGKELSFPESKDFQFITWLEEK